MLEVLILETRCSGHSNKWKLRRVRPPRQAAEDPGDGDKLGLLRVRVAHVVSAILRRGTDRLQLSGSHERGSQRSHERDAEVA